MSNELLIHNAEEKLKRELTGVSGQKEKAMAKAVCEALISFCRQEPELAQAVIEGKGTFQDCMKAVAKGIGNSISDLEAYKRAVKFYFPGADIRFHMTVDLCASAKDGGRAPLAISLLDLL